MFSLTGARCEQVFALNDREDSHRMPDGAEARSVLSRVFSVGNTRAAGLWPFVNFIANCGFCCHVSLWCCADEKAQCAVVDILCSIIFTEALRSCFARQVDSVAIIGCDFVLHFWHHGDFVARQT